MYTIIMGFDLIPMYIPSIFRIPSHTASWLSHHKTIGRLICSLLSMDMFHCDVTEKDAAG